MDKFNQPDNTNTLINRDLLDQQNAFKERLEQRKQKSNSFILIDKTDKDSINSPNLTYKNVTFNLSNVKGKKTNNTDDNDIIFVNNENVTPRGFRIDDKEQENELEDVDINNLDKLFKRRHTEKNKIKSQKKANTEDFTLNNNGNIKGIKENIDYFLSDFNSYFSDNIFNQYTERIEKLFDLKYKKYLEVSNYYNNQIKEMEFLLTESTGGDHQDTINNMIINFKKELNSALEKNVEIYKELIKKTYDKFQKNWVYPKQGNC